MSHQARRHQLFQNLGPQIQASASTAFFLVSLLSGMNHFGFGVSCEHLSQFFTWIQAKKSDSEGLTWLAVPKHHFPYPFVQFHPCVHPFISSAASKSEDFETFNRQQVGAKITYSTWRIIPASRYLATMVIISPLTGVVGPLPNGHSWLINGG